MPSSILMLAQGASAPPPGAQIGTLMLPLVIIAIWYFVVIRPQRQKEEKTRREMLDGLTPGTRVLTTGGIYATISQRGEGTFKLKIADNVKIEVVESAIAGPQTTRTDSKSPAS